jgi:O-antigen/teichoic acid export membrane protein
VRRALVRPLFSFSGWLGLSGLLYAVTTSVDKLVIGSLITVQAVSYYSAPYEAINKIGVVPASLSMVLFPAFSLLDAGGRTGRSEALFARSSKFLLLTTGPVFIVLMFFARDFLRLWLGPDFAVESALAVQLLAAGFLVNTVMTVPNSYLIGIGRVDVAPKYQAVELVAFTALAWAGAKLWGLDGVAAATALRLAAFCLFLLAVSFKSGRVRFAYVWKRGLGGPLAVLALLAAGLGLNAVLDLGIWGAGALLLAFAAVSFFGLLEAEERAFVTGFLRGRRAAGAAAPPAPEHPGVLGQR